MHVVRPIPQQATRVLGRMLRRRAAIEPTIGHLKSGHRLDRSDLVGRGSDRINAVLSAAGYNLRKLLRWLVGGADVLAHTLAHQDAGRRKCTLPTSSRSARPEFVPAMF